MLRRAVTARTRGAVGSPPVPGKRHHRSLVPLLDALRRPAALVPQALVLLGLMGGTAGWALTAKTVTVTVDGVPREIRTHGTAVRDALRESGYDAGPYDLVAPAPEQRLDDGDHIALRRARQLSLVLDGKTRKVWVTAASLQEALTQIGIRTDGARVSASRSREIPIEGLTVSVQTRKAVAVVADGKVKVLSTTGSTVGDALREAGIVLGRQDQLSLPREAPVEDLTTVRVTRVSGHRVIESLPVAFDTVRRADPDLYAGDTKVLKPGRPGVLVRTYLVRYVDNALRSKQMTAEAITEEPVAQVVAVGTKARPAARTSSATGTSADDQNWAGLARCESGGNPRAVSSTGKYRGLYQFSIATWHAVGGDGDPIDASPAEQTYRAKVLYSRSGRGQWPVCGKYL